MSWSVVPYYIIGIHFEISLRLTVHAPKWPRVKWPSAESSLRLNDHATLKPLIVSFWNTIVLYSVCLQRNIIKINFSFMIQPPRNLMGRPCWSAKIITRQSGDLCSRFAFAGKLYRRNIPFRLTEPWNNMTDTKLFRLSLNCFMQAIRTRPPVT